MNHDGGEVMKCHLTASNESRPGGIAIGSIRRFLLDGAAFAALALACARPVQGQAVTALPSVDLNRFAGSWYEIARLPNKREKSCLADVLDLIAVAYKKDHLQLVRSCEAKNGYTDVSNAEIEAAKGGNGSKLKVTYVWPFSERIWILALGTDYSWVLLGSPNHKDLMVLARTRALGPDAMSEIEQKAASEGYATGKLTRTLQTAR